MRPIVIAHRGASGYLPEHTLPAKALAHAQGADFLEQDLAMTKDDELLVVHDHFLDRVSDVAWRFPDRARPDGRFYVMDFLMDEIRSLRATEGFEIKDGAATPIFDDRFPLWKSRFSFHTFAEEIEFIQGLNSTTGRDVGLYTELKAPWLHHQEGKDIAAATYEVLKSYGYRDSGAYLQCFDPHELVRIKNELGPATGVDLPLVQLIAYTDWHETQEQLPDGSWRNYDYDWMLRPGGMPRIAEYAVGIGPDYHMLVDAEPGRGEPGQGESGLGESDKPRPNSIVADAHAAGLLVHPYTIRKDQLPDWADDVDQVYDVVLRQARVDGIFTDYPALGVGFLDRWGAEGFR